MLEPIRGIHHITAIASGPQRNLDFYTQVLGLHLVKLTVNFDDPGTYHFYFGDQTGHPGTILTFFPWVEARRGRRGLGQVSEVAFTIPPNAIRFWVDRLKQLGISAAAPFARFDEEVLTLVDPDGLQIELVAREAADQSAPWTGNPVPAEYAIRGLAAPTLLLEESDQTASLLVDIFGLRQVRQAGPRFRFMSENIAGGLVDIEIRPNELPGRTGAGTVHHIAWRAPDDAQQEAWHELLIDKGFNLTPILDRQYFHSIYFREPGGILFEIATDSPGFAADETVDRLGSQLKLPPWLEPKRAEIEKILPAVQLPSRVKS